MPITLLEYVYEKLEIVAKNAKPFTLVFDGIEYFEGANNVAYVSISNQTPVKELHRNLNNSLKGLIQEAYNQKFINDHFIPHMTIGEKIPGTIFPDVKKRFTGYKISHESEISDFSLFCGENGKWQVMRVFNLTGHQR
jgi:2'-5' RNA ligase